MIVNNCTNIIKEEFEGTKGVIRIGKLKKDRQHNGQKKKDKRTNNDLENATHKIIYHATQTLLKNGGKLRFSGRVGSSFSTSSTHRVALVTNLVMNEERTGKCLRHMEHIHSHL